MFEEKSFNPWLSIWVKPRATIARIVSENPNRSLWFLAAIYGFSSLLNMFQSASLGMALSALPLVIIALILSPFWGYAVFSVWSWVVMWTGRWFKGKGDFASVRAAYSWSCVPLIGTAIFWLVMIVLFGQQIFLNFPEGERLSQAMLSLLFLILIAKVVLAIWSIVIYLNALAQVHQFSVLRAILNVIVAALIVGLVLGVFWILFLNALGAGVEHSKAAFQLLNDGTSLEALRRGL